MEYTGMAEMTSKLNNEDLEQIGQYLAEKYPILKSGANQLRYSEIDLDIRERIVRVEEELKNQRELIYEVLKMMDKRFEEARTDSNARFEQVDKRFEQVDKRFEQVDKRFEEMRLDMNSRFEQVDKRFEEMLTDMNKRFEETNSNMNSRFNMMMWFMGLGFTIITAFIAGVLVILK
jgi:exonuclease VII large subunit